MADRRLVQVRLPADLVKTVDHLKVDQGISRAAMIEALLREALTRYQTGGADRG